MADQPENFVIAENIQFAPFRTLNEFILDARFEVKFGLIDIIRPWYSSFSCRSLTTWRSWTIG